MERDRGGKEGGRWGEEREGGDGLASGTGDFPPLPPSLE